MSRGLLITLTETNRPIFEMMTTEKSIPEDAVTMAVTEDGYLYFNAEESKAATLHTQGRFAFPKITMLSYYEVEFED